MLVALDIILSIGLLLIGLALVVLLRQIGIIASRLSLSHATAEKQAPLARGTKSPLAELTIPGRAQSVTLPVVPGHSTCLLFASFGCSTCQPLLRELSTLPRDIQRRVVVMLLDGDRGREFSSLVKRWHLNDFLIVDAHLSHANFRINQTPCVYVLDSSNRIEAYAEPKTVKELVEAVNDQQAADHQHLTGENDANG